MSGQLGCTGAASPLLYCGISALGPAAPAMPEPSRIPLMLCSVCRGPDHALALCSAQATLLWAKEQSGGAEAKCRAQLTRSPGLGMVNTHVCDHTWTRRKP